MNRILFVYLVLQSSHTKGEWVEIIQKPVKSVVPKHNSNISNSTKAPSFFNSYNIRETEHISNKKADLINSHESYTANQNPPVSDKIIVTSPGRGNKPIYGLIEKVAYKTLKPTFESEVLKITVDTTDEDDKPNNKISNIQNGLPTNSRITQNVKEHSVEKFKSNNNVKINNSSHFKPNPKIKLIQSPILYDAIQYEEDTADKIQPNQLKQVEKPLEAAARPFIQKNIKSDRVIKQIEDNVFAKRVDVSKFTNVGEKPIFVTKTENFAVKDNHKIEIVDTFDQNITLDSTADGIDIYSEDDEEENSQENLPTSSTSQPNTPESQPEENKIEKPSVIENLIKLLKHVTDIIKKNTQNGLKGKINYLHNLKNMMLSNIVDRIESIWPDDDSTAEVTSRQARGHVEFPSSEGALMTISFLTFAVFLIKLILQIIHTFKNKTALATPAVVTISRAAMKAFKKDSGT